MYLLNQHSSLDFVHNQNQKQSRLGHFFNQRTHEFFCLALKTQERAPSRAEEFELQECGLGRKKICFHSKAKFTDIREKLEEEFPKLKTGGGFVILRTGREGSNNLLSVIPPPTTGLFSAFSERLFWTRTSTCIYKTFTTGLR